MHAMKLLVSNGFQNKWFVFEVASEGLGNHSLHSNPVYSINR